MSNDLRAAIDAVRDNWDRRAPAYDRFYQDYAQDKRVAWRATCEKALVELLGRRDGPLDVLDVGTGTGFLSTLLAELGHNVTAIDASSTMLGYARAEARRRDVAMRTVACGAHDVAALGAEFDLVTSRYVLWTLPDPVAALRAWRGIVKPGGGLLLADGVWHTWRHDLRRLGASLRPGGDRRFPWLLLRDYAQIGHATPHWAGLTANRARALLAAGGFQCGTRHDRLLPRYARPVSADFFILGTRPAQLP
ncbi:Methyltransferase domain-containing protein [Saccharopolyspora shandongensis]|uniref:Methyltransferase domain-containing protein n=1 Tax=Saccharopolyspora shandongensis TaxID=418495 RepID=A0A1H2ZJE2_9PSEU|nr:class I SAM-dependent methyltransferase [Saccharopolyspora shandongensis]SDX16884.1 Methyltransferase domain-containing protein [Saccharopolyspora shandongensis]